MTAEEAALAIAEMGEGFMTAYLSGDGALALRLFREAEQYGATWFLLCELAGMIRMFLEDDGPDALVVWRSFMTDLQAYRAAT